MCQGVRGVATGFIVAFDKHWNLAMKDVEEQFTRRRTSKVLDSFNRTGNVFSMTSIGARPWAKNTARRSKKWKERRKDWWKRSEGCAGMCKRAHTYRILWLLAQLLQVLRKVEVCVRHVPQVSDQQPALGICKLDKAFLQVLLRGEHVVMVAAALPWLYFAT